MKKRTLFEMMLVGAPEPTEEELRELLSPDPHKEERERRLKASNEFILTAELSAEAIKSIKVCIEHQVAFAEFEAEGYFWELSCRLGEFSRGKTRLCLSEPGDIHQLRSYALSCEANPRFEWEAPESKTVLMLTKAACRKLLTLAKVRKALKC